MIATLLLVPFAVSFQPDTPKDPVVDIKKFVPTREPKKIPDDLRAAGPFDDDFPIPQDAKIAEANRAAALAWSKKLFLTSFEASADKNAAWYAAAKKGLEAQAAYFVDVNQRDGRWLDPMIDGYRQALLAECDQPFVQLQAFPHLGFRGEAGRGYSTDYGRIVDAVLKGPYPPLVKADEALTAAIMLETAQQRGSQFPQVDYYGQFWTHFVELCKSTNPHDMSHAASLANRVIVRYVQLGQKRQDGWKAVNDALTMAKADASLRGLCEGSFRLQYARDAQRGNADADEKAKLKKERLAQTRKALTDAATKNPQWAAIAVMMIRVSTDEDAPREEMEKWFTAAMQADPDSFSACQAKLDYFDRANDRNPKAMVTFGRQCLRTKNDHAFLGLILFEVHLRIKRTQEDEYYFSKAEPWADVREVFETRLKVRPDDRYARSRWGLHCLQAGEGPGAYHNLLAVKKNPWVDVFAQTSFDSALSQARQLARDQEMPPW